MTTADASLPQATGHQRDVFGIVGASRAQNKFLRWWIALQVTADYVSVLAGILITWKICRADAIFTAHSPLIPANLIALFALYIFRYLHLYEETSAGPNIQEIENLLRAVSLIAFGTFIGSALHEGTFQAVRVSAVGFALVLLLLMIERHACVSALQWARQRGHFVRRILVCGTQHGASLFAALESNPRLGIRCIGFLDSTSGIHLLRPQPSGVRVFGNCDDLTEVVCRESVDEVAIADPCMSRDTFARVMEQCEALQVPVSFVPGRVGPYHPWFNFQLLDGIPWARRRSSGFVTARSIVKRAIDFVLSLACVVLLSPLLLLVAILVKLDSRGPIFFTQERVGLGGELFRLFKFRSMKVDSPKYEHSPTATDDPRITRLGRILRRTSIDELPQLFNVLRGDMSLVGPRPEMPFIVAQYGPVERGRLRAKPGMTGLWQISHARTAPIHSHVDYDLFYIEHQNIFLDCAILISTVTAVIRGTGIY